MNVIIIASFSFFLEFFHFAIENTMSLFSKSDVFLTKFEKIDVWWWDSNCKTFDMMYVFFDVLNSLIDIAVSSFFIISLRVCDRVFRDFTSNSFVLKLIISSLILKTSLRLKRFCWFCSFFEFRRFNEFALMWRSESILSMFSWIWSWLWWWVYRALLIERHKCRLVSHWLW